MAKIIVTRKMTMIKIKTIMKHRDTKVPFAGTGVLRSVMFLLLMTVLVVNNVWGATVTYHIINLGRLDDSGVPTSTRTEALKFTVTGDNVTVGNNDIFNKYKSPLAKNWKYYSSDDVTYVEATKVCTFNAGPSLNESSILSANADVYVTYELDEAAFNAVGVFDGGIYRIKFPNDYYLKQTTYNSDINTNPVKNPGASETEFLWKFNIIDPYQITVQSQSHNATANCFDYFLSSSNGPNLDDIRLKQTLTAAKNTKVWAFGLLNGGTPGTYRLVVADGFNGATSQGRDDFNHGYLNDNYVKSNANKTTYHRYDGNSHNNCDLTIEIFSAKYTFHIINNSNVEAIRAKATDPLNAGATITESMIPDILKSPAASNYSFYPTAADAVAGDNAITTLPQDDDDIYVRYETSSGIFGEIKYNLSVGGEHYLYAANTTTISSAATSGAAETYQWTLQGSDPYKFTIKNVDNNQFITYDVSNGEAAPTLSGTGSNFFLHQSSSGKYELVVIGNNYPDSYYTLGYDDTNGLKLYSNTNYSFGAAEIQTVLASTTLAIINPLPTANNRTYDGTTQDLVTAGTCANGTIKYREGTTGEYVETIPTKKDAGTYHVYYMSVGNAGYDNYVAPDPIIVTIAPAPVTVTAVNKTKVYGESDPTLTATVTGLISGESESLITYTLSRAAGQDVGNYTITPAGEALQGNYTVTFENGELTINKRTVGITWGVTSFDYNGTPQAPTATATNLVYDDEIGITVTGAQTSVGTYTATASGLTGTKKGNYQLPTAKTTSFTISQASINTTIVMTEWSYGDYDALTNSPSLSYNPENVTVTYLYKVKGANDETYAAAVPTNVGTYTVQASVPGTVNSSAQILTKDFTISQKALNKDDAGAPAKGITVTVSKAINNPGTEQETITYPVTVTHNYLGTPKNLVQYVDDDTDYDYKVSGSQSVSGYVVTVTAKKEGDVYTGNYTGYAKAAYANPPFYLDGAAWSSSENEYAAVYLGLFDGVPNLESGNEIKAYIVNKVNPTIGTVTVSPVEYTSDDTTNPPTKANYIPEGVPVLLLSNKENLSGFATTSPTEATSDITAAVKYSNKLMIAPDEPIDPKDPESPHGVAVKDAEAYIFYKGEFVLAKEGTIKPDYFFIYNPNYQVQSGDGTSPARRRTLRIVIEGYETGIDEIMEVGNRVVQDAAWYSLDGRRLMGKPTKKGLYITNGQKVIVK